MNAVRQIDKNKTRSLIDIKIHAKTRFSFFPIRIEHASLVNINIRVIFLHMFRQ